jgi:hypothetical protein
MASSTEPQPYPSDRVADAFAAHLSVPNRRQDWLNAIDRIQDPERRAEVARLEIDAARAAIRRLRANAAGQLIAQHGSVARAADHLRNEQGERRGEPMTREGLRQLLNRADAEAESGAAP